MLMPELESVASAPRRRGIDVGGRAVLVATGWDEHWGTSDFLSDNPFLTGPAATWLVDAGAALVGIDSLNVDSLADPERPGTPRSWTRASRSSST